MQGSGGGEVAEREPAPEPMRAAPEQPGNGSHDAPAPEVERTVAPREYHAESSPAREPAPLAHFEPQPRPESGSAPSKPYVVWSSAPPSSETGPRGQEE
jgi:hypothetical protein